MQNVRSKYEISTDQPNLTILEGANRGANGYGRVNRAIAATDYLSVAVGMLVGHELVFGLRIPSVQVLTAIFLAPAFVIAVFHSFRLYQAFQLPGPEEFRRVVLALTVGVAGLVLFAFFAQSSFSRGWVGVSSALSALFILAGRAIWRRYTRRAWARGDLTLRTLIVGANEEAERLAHAMRDRKLGFLPIGYVLPSGAMPQANALPVLGNVSDLRILIQETDADCVFVAASAVGFGDMRYVSKAARQEGLEVRLTTNLLGVKTTRLSLQPMAGTIALAVAPVRLTGPQNVAKRVFDVVLSSIGLIITMPLWALIALAIKLDSRGPILYRHERVGQRGKPFVMFKFRTMVVGADLARESLEIHNEASRPLFKLRNDPRVTRVGKWLRRTSLDELPQLLNVLRSEMSLVGPRPPLASEVAQYNEWHYDRLEVSPGITGLWQISGRSEVSFDEYVRLDVFYIENWSLAYDLFILAKTVPSVLRRRGAY